MRTAAASHRGGPGPESPPTRRGPAIGETVARAQVRPSAVWSECHFGVAMMVASCVRALPARGQTVSWAQRPPTARAVTAQSERARREQAATTASARRQAWGFRRGRSRLRRAEPLLARDCFQPHPPARGRTAASRLRATSPRRDRRALLTANVELLPSHAFDRAATPPAGNDSEAVTLSRMAAECCSGEYSTGTETNPRAASIVASGTARMAAYPPAATAWRAAYSRSAC
jgi:hypothetical protein